ncbi:NACHT domain-containing protein [Microdochium trichocladiopsis]|uniref:NACHT domain-containing protein n=1 Tax=Microdochium trichocladiopsis TaxID=1682393 RepID=A0A9P9BM00_9PEZI|nr:NACHT domain-containing protein [Microdochium trichocladiopsis]KAH7025765.1 NACHT domain-containing protein [Microdochium trichocladiopsis]
MRLLGCHTDGSLRITGNLIDNIPRYAILSHTWGDDEQEVNLRDIQDGTGQHKDGYEKLMFCALQASKDGLQYFWVDTCCIDQSNSTELYEAINSMFRWYQNATHCYAYLTDVSDACASWQTAFRNSRWLTRGWTLQELVAPKSVIFFAKEGQRLGDKASLEMLLHETTGIPAEALQGAPLADFSINDRFSWVGNRKTKRPEDKAYCLLGIFGVFMPMIYGEGEEKAMSRLRWEIGKDLISDAGKQCLADLRVTDPRDDKLRIQETKGGLLEHSYTWVLHNPGFRQWHDGESQRLLWVRGDPGKGKTMLLCGIIDQLRLRPVEHDKRRLIAFFFCQTTDDRINSATNVLRGLIFMLIDQDATLLSHLERKYEAAGRALFEDVNAWQALCNIFVDILQDARLHEVYLAIDALDECATDLPQLLDLIVRVSHSRSRVKWLVSSRNWAQIEERLSTAARGLSLEVNSTSVADAVERFINHKVAQLAQKKSYSANVVMEIHQHLSANANGTFLWVALVLQELDKAPRWSVLQRLKSFPAGLDHLYLQMIQNLLEFDGF